MWNAHYNIFGKIDKLSKKEIDNPIRMQGQYEDEETGLYYNRYRYYDPNISAYVSQDPLGLGAGENVYSYVKNSFGWIDPLGLSGELLSGEGSVGAYGKLIGTPGDNLIGHHMPSAAYMQQKFGIKPKDSIAMQMEHNYPSNTGRHAETRTFRQKPFLNESPRDALAKDIKDARRIYQKEGLYTTEIRKGLQDVVKQNKEKFPDIFKKIKKCGG